MMTDTPKYKILSSSSLKIIAMLSMLIDHAALMFMSYDATYHEPYFSVGKIAVSDYFLCRNIIGRLAFPLFAFLIVEGFHHTKSHTRYARNLLLFAIISIIPWNLAHGNILYHSSQNVLFTLFMGVVAMSQIDKITRYHSQHNSLPPIPTLLLVTELFLIQLVHLDYGTVGVIYIILLHILRNNTLNQFLATLATFTYSKFSRFNFLAYIPISMYNGRRGFIKGKVSKYLMYTFYPAHILILWAISQFL